LAGSGKLYIVGTVVHQEVKDILVSEVASHLVWCPVASQSWDVIRSVASRILFREIPVRYSNANRVGIAFDMASDKIEVAHSSGHKNVRSPDLDQ
jgi:hypothetical protein